MFSFKMKPMEVRKRFPTREHAGFFFGGMAITLNMTHFATQGDHMWPLNGTDAATQGEQ